MQASDYLRLVNGLAMVTRVFAVMAILAAAGVWLLRNPPKERHLLKVAAVCVAVAAVSSALSMFVTLTVRVVPDEAEVEPSVNTWLNEYTKPREELQNEVINATPEKPEGEEPERDTTVTAVADTQEEPLDITALLAEHGYWYYGRDPVLPTILETAEEVADHRWWVYTDGTNVVRLLDNTTDMIHWTMCDHGDTWSMVWMPIFSPEFFDKPVVIEGEEYRTCESVLAVLTDFLEYDDCDTVEGEVQAEPDYHNGERSYREYGAASLGRPA